MQKTPKMIEYLDAISDEQVNQARRVCADHATDALDLMILLDMLGIGPNWRQTWNGPVLGETIAS